MNHISNRQGRRISRSGCDEGPLIKWMLILVSGIFLTVFLLLPLANVFVHAFSRGVRFYVATLQEPNTWAAIRLTLTVAGISVPLNLLFGLAAAWAVGKFDFRGKTLMVTLIDLPFAVSPVVAGLLFVLLLGQQGFLGPWLQAHNVKVIFALPGLVLATVFVTFPFVARELIPIMQAAGHEQEQAALTLGANGWQTFWHVTLPSVKWGLVYGIILCNARAMGEFGAVSVVSGHIVGQTDTMPLHVEKLYNEYHSTEAFVVASLLATLALLTLLVKCILEWKTRREHWDAQRAHSAQPIPDISPQGP